MSERPIARSEDTDSPPPAPRAPMIVSQGLTFRDLQRAIFLTFGLILVYHMAGPLTTLLLFFLLVFILAAVINPLAVRMEERGWPRPWPRMVTAMVVALLVLGFLGLLGWLAVPPLIDEAGQFFSKLPEKQSRLTQIYNQQLGKYPALRSVVPEPQELLQAVGRSASALLGQVGRYTMNLAVGIVSLLLLLVLVIFTVGHPTPLIAGLLAATPRDQRVRMEMALRRILEQLKNWAFGSLVLGVIIGLMTAAGLWVLGLLTGQRFPYILMFSLLAGLGELIPNIGPVVSAIPPVLVALTIDPMLAVYVLVLFVVIQQLENNLIVPLVMGQSLNLHPVSVTFTVLVMGVLFGVMGAILAVPVCAIVKVLWEEFYIVPRNTDRRALEAIAEDIVRRGLQGDRAETPLGDAVDAVLGDRTLDETAPPRGAADDLPLPPARGE